MWLFGGIITLSKFWVNIAAAKNATARNASLPKLTMLAAKNPGEKSAEIAKFLTSGTWTHDYPITYERARELGLPVRADMPENMLRLMQL
jgi:hypothetical protein